jgi:hypothetical protein
MEGAKKPHQMKFQHKLKSREKQEHYTISAVVNRRAMLFLTSFTFIEEFRPLSKRR